MKSFFSLSTVKSKPTTSTISHCGACGLSKSCITPKMKPTGNGKKKILIVAEAPGEDEDKKGVQLIGKSGQLLRETLEQLNVKLNRDCWKTNAIICHPKKDIPLKKKILACRPNLIKTINKLKPNVIITLGGVAAESLLSYAWKNEDVSGIKKWAGFCIPCQKLNTWIIPTYHPAYILRMNSDILENLLYKHLKMGVRKSKHKPFKTIPDYKKKIDVILRPSKAAKAIKQLSVKSKCISFDYETNCLKPEYDKSEIVSCSVCFDGGKTIAYPFEGDAIEATSKLLKSPVRKIAANIKFEDRWTMNKLRHPVKNWYWDTMIAAHVIDNRSGITGLKFQSFVMLGAEDYDSHISPFLKSKDNSKLNRIREINIEDLLLYNGMDSLLEYKLAMKQIKILEVK